MSGHLSLGVIGHVDHGKTSLVKALTGIDTDRLPEEKARGMSIVLGFAHLAAGAATIDLIDVPGHENFVRTMVAGATGIDAALLAVDVREGVKPQTIEHLAITELIGVRRGIVALTKCDGADRPGRLAALDRLHAALRGTYLECAPTVFTSAADGTGLPELRAGILALVKPRPAAPDAPFYLPVDRAFSMAGRGTIVTGTLRAGVLRSGDEVELMPRGLRAVVREVEIHRARTELGMPGQRIGVNLRHVKPHEIVRGDALAAPGLLHAARLLDVELDLLKSERRALRDGEPARLLFGTSDVPVRVRLLAQRELAPGQRALAQLRTARPVAAMPGEAFILRRDSPPTTIGGGRILDPAACRHGHDDPDTLQRLAAFARGSARDALAAHLKSAGYAGIALGAAAASLGTTPAALQCGLDESVAVAVELTHLVYRPFLEALGDMVVAALSKFHRQHPLRAGAPLAYCRAGLPHSVGDAVFRHVLQRLGTGKRIDVVDGVARIFGHDPFAALSAAQRARAAEIVRAVRAAGLAPPDIEQLAHDEPERELLRLLADHGELLMIPGEQAGRNLVFHRDIVAQAECRMRTAFAPPAQFTVSELRMRLGSTRKFMVPLLAYFDRQGITRRRGDRRSVAVQEGKSNGGE